MSKTSWVLELRILSLQSSDTNTRRLANFEKEIVEKRLKANNIKARYLCRKSFVILDILLTTKTEAKKLS